MTEQDDSDVREREMQQMANMSYCRFYNTAEDLKGLLRQYGPQLSFLT